MDREQAAQRAEELRFLERREMRDLVVAENLDSVGMDEVEVAHQRRDLGAVAAQQRAHLPPCRRSRRALAFRDCPHTAARR